VLGGVLRRSFVYVAGAASARCSLAFNCRPAPPAGIHFARRNYYGSLIFFSRTSQAISPARASNLARQLFRLIADWLLALAHASLSRYWKGAARGVVVFPQRVFSRAAPGLGQHERHRNRTPLEMSEGRELSETSVRPRDASGDGLSPPSDY
jgi:hypothetical protein